MMYGSDLSFICYIHELRMKSSTRFISQLYRYVIQLLFVVSKFVIMQ
jgi:hypothetical protein